MDAKTARAHLAEVQGQLARNEDEHEVLISLARGYEGWLRLNPEPVSQLPLSLESGSRSRSESKGNRSLRGAVLQVIKDARGEPITTREILNRALALGAATQATNPLGAVDLMAYSLKKGHPVEKVGPRTWRWTASPENRDGAPI